MSSLNLIYHLLQKAENGEQKLRIHMLRELVKKTATMMKRKTSTCKNLKSRVRLKILTSDTTISGDDNSRRGK
jgi:hypothetical protein